ncbi:ABC transporter ATP-binding protein, partial [Casaltella massiliensis]|nr:ABC transporter ATP-binding protein [Casaltella massiliensis]
CILENDYLFDHLSASENIDVFCDYFTVNIKEKNEIMNKYIKYLGIENDLYKKVHEFSKGMKRKLSLLISILK